MVYIIRSGKLCPLRSRGIFFPDTEIEKRFPKISVWMILNYELICALKFSFIESTVHFI